MNSTALTEATSREGDAVVMRPDLSRATCTANASISTCSASTTQSPSANNVLTPVESDPKCNQAKLSAASGSGAGVGITAKVPETGNCGKPNAPSVAPSNPIEFESGSFVVTDTIEDQIELLSTKTEPANASVLAAPATASDALGSANTCAAEAPDAAAVSLDTALAPVPLPQQLHGSPMSPPDLALPVADRL